MREKSFSQLDNFLKNQKLNEAYDAEIKRLKENATRFAAYKKEKMAANRIKELRRNRI